MNKQAGSRTPASNQATLHDLRYAQATSNRERASATYSRVLADIRRLPRDADRETAYGQLDRLLEELRHRITTGGRR